MEDIAHNMGNTGGPVPGQWDQWQHGSRREDTRIQRLKQKDKDKGQDKRTKEDMVHDYGTLQNMAGENYSFGFYIHITKCILTSPLHVDEVHLKCIKFFVVA